MRNLKRVLSLALALVMVLGMMVITTSAAKFGDEDEITYTEAVDVISAIGVITGDNGNFYPNRALTREEGAALICYLLMGKDAADKLVGSGKFADVKADRWSAGEIDYCANLGIIRGYTDADGKQVFDPKGELTAVAYGRMLLGALGYDGDVEGYTGGNWATAIASDMIDIGLDVKNVDMDKVLTRQEAAQMTLQALECDMVKYESKGSSITINGVEIVSGASAAETIAADPDDSYKADDEDDTLQFVEKYFAKLAKVAGEDDAFGRPASYGWTYDNEDVVNVMKAPVKTYTSEVKGGKLYTDLGKPKTAPTYNVYVNGNDTDVTLNIVSGNMNTSVGGEGVLTEIYKIGNNTYTIVCVETFFGTITDHTEAVLNKDGEIEVKEKVTVGYEGTTGNFDTTDFSEADEPKGPKAGTAVLVTAVNGVVKSVKAAEGDTVVVSSVTANESCIADGTTYKFSENIVAAPEYSSLPTATNEYNVWFDNYGNIINVQAVVDEAATGYALALAASTSNDGWTDGSETYQLKLMMTDGTTQTVATDEDSYDIIDTNDVCVVKYEINNKGEYTIEEYDAVADADDDFALTTGVSKIVVDESTDAYANNKTVFFVGETKGNKVNYKVVTGIAAMDSIVDEAGETEVAMLSAQGVLKAVVVVDAADASGNNDVKDVVYIQYKPNASTITDASGSYKVYNAVVAGEITTVKVDTTYSVTADTLASVVSYNDKGLIVDMDQDFTAPASKIVASEITTAVKDGIVVTAAGTFSVADDCAVYVDGAAGITVGTQADLKDGATLTAVLVKGIITTVFVTPAV